jgi:hypothetical protein
MANSSKNNDLPALYTAMGSAISTWAVIEIQLYQIFAVSTSLTILQPGGGFSIGSTTAYAVLDAVDSFRGKLLMIDAALTSALQDPDADAIEILNLWASERAKLSGLQGNRNKLAHWTAAQTFRNGARHKVKLVPPALSQKSGADHPGCTETDIREWQSTFESGAKRLAALCERLAAHRGLQHRFLLQVASQVRCSLPADREPLEFLTRELSLPL